MRFRVAIAVIAGLPLLSGSTSAARDPWNLNCAAMPVERQAPTPLSEAALRFFPWIRPAAEELHSGPLYLVALSTRTAISRDGDPRDGSGYYLHRALIGVAPSYRANLVLTGRRLGTSTRRAILGFSTNGATACTVDPPDVSCGSRPLRFASALEIKRHDGWRIAETELRIGRTGCFAITATGPGLRAVIPLSVPGPDYGTPGW